MPSQRRSEPLQSAHEVPDTHSSHIVKPAIAVGTSIPVASTLLGTIVLTDVVVDKHAADAAFVVMVLRTSPIRR